MDLTEYNKRAWNKFVENKDQWTIPVSSQIIENARNGNFSIVLTPEKPVPDDWFPQPLKGKKVLALASGGGQQGPVLAASGAEVTIFDNSPLQLEQDRIVATRDNLILTTVEGDMANLSCFATESFDFIFHPCSNCFVPDVKKVWQEAYRVLKKGGSMISGFCNPIIFTPDFELEKAGVTQLKSKIPYSDLDSLTEQEREKYIKNGPLSFGHSLEDLIGGQIKAGFILTGFYEDNWDAENSSVARYLNCFIATKALKPL